MEWMEGGDLGGFMKAEGPQAELEAREVTAQVLEGLAVLHENGIFHRNLKPQVWYPFSAFPVRKLRLTFLEHPDRVCLPRPHQNCRSRSSSPGNPHRLPTP